MSVKNREVFFVLLEWTILNGSWNFFILRQADHSFLFNSSTFAFACPLFGFRERDFS